MEKLSDRADTETSSRGRDDASVAYWPSFCLLMRACHDAHWGSNDAFMLPLLHDGIGDGPTANEKVISWLKERNEMQFELWAPTPIQSPHDLAELCRTCAVLLLRVGKWQDRAKSSVGGTSLYVSPIPNEPIPGTDYKPTPLVYDVAALAGRSQYPGKPTFPSDPSAVGSAIAYFEDVAMWASEIEEKVASERREAVRREMNGAAMHDGGVDDGLDAALKLLKVARDVAGPWNDGLLKGILYELDRAVPVCDAPFPSETDMGGLKPYPRRWQRSLERLSKAYSRAEKVLVPMLPKFRRHWTDGFGFGTIRESSATAFLLAIIRDIAEFSGAMSGTREQREGHMMDGWIADMWERVQREPFASVRWHELEHAIRDEFAAFDAATDGGSNMHEWPVVLAGRSAEGAMVVAANDEAVANENEVDVDALLASSDIARRFRVDSEALRKRLERWRRENIVGWREVQTRARNEPRYLYQLSAVKSVVDELRSREPKQSSSDRTSDKRPTKKNRATKLP